MAGAKIIEGIGFVYFGHASFMIKAEGKTIYMDPYIIPKNPEPADIIFITHEHYDHCANWDELSKENTVIVSTQHCINKIGKGHPTLPGDSGEVYGVKFESVHAYNPKKKFHPKGRGVGYVITLAGKKIYHAGDTELIPEMSEIKDIDIALLPIGGTYTMDVEQAIEAAKTIKPKIVIPMHYGKLGDIDLEGNPHELERGLQGTGIRVVII